VGLAAEGQAAVAAGPATDLDAGAVGEHQAGAPAM
jgi:hypothetical protein